MSGYFSMGNDLRDHWFKIGRTEVGTTLFVVGLVVLSWLVDVMTMASMRTSLVSILGFSAGHAVAGEAWRAVTWPLANSLDIWPVLNLFFFYIFGTELEQRLGKVRMAKLLGGIWLVLTLVALAIGLALGGGSMLAGISTVQFILLLLWIAEYPNRPFFFGIPAWVIGAVLVAVQALGMVAMRNVLGLLEMLLGFVLVAIVAKRLGLLRDYDWIPGSPSAPKPSRPAKPTKVAKEQAKRQAARAKDDARLDELLDLISAKGMDSLTPAQRRELMKLRNRR